MTSFSAYNLGYLLTFLAENEDLVANSPVQLVSLSEAILHKELKARLQLLTAAEEAHSPALLFIHDSLLPAVASLQCCDAVLNLDIPLSEKALRGRQAMLRPSAATHEGMDHIDDQEEEEEVEEHSGSMYVCSSNVNLGTKQAILHRETILMSPMLVGVSAPFASIWSAGCRKLR